MELNSFAPGAVKLTGGLIKQRFDLNHKYVSSLKNENLLQNHLLEAGLWTIHGKPDNSHWGWESPLCQLRGHFLGHWMSAASRIYLAVGDESLKARVNQIVGDLARCQQANGGEWVASIPEKYLEWAHSGKQVWAPHYTVHKTMLGLFDAYKLLGNEQALEVLINFAKWFTRYTQRFSRKEMDDILDVETGGMLEAFANLYGETKRQEHLDLVHAYDRARFFDRVLAGEDALTDKHANTTIPEVLGAARAWEVTGERRWRDIAEAYWKSAVTDRGYFCTGGQTNGEVWTPPHEFSTRLSATNQEHCTVYHMMALAQALFRWTGKAEYADYWERNLYNGILAQQSARTGQVAYYLGLEAGSKKGWGTPTDNFWCCHGTLVQAQSGYDTGIFFEGEGGLALAQYIPCETVWNQGGAPVKLRLTDTAQSKLQNSPDAWRYELAVSCQERRFGLKVRIPRWVSGAPRVAVNGVPADLPVKSGFFELDRVWKEDTVTIELPKKLMAEPMDDRPDTVAFMNGPVVYAGLLPGGRELTGDAARPVSMLQPRYICEWDRWRLHYCTVNQTENFKLIPLYEVEDQNYTVYFPVKDISGARL